MQNDLRIKIINAKEEVEFKVKEINAIKTRWWQLEQIYFITGCQKKKKSLNKTEPSGHRTVLKILINVRVNEWNLVIATTSCKKS